MTYSIYHFFADLCQKKEEFFPENELESFPFDEQMLSCVGDGKFPDLAIKLNNDNEQFTGGELIELKESKDKYSVASFNSTIPTGEKDIRTLTEGKTNTIRTQMQEAGNNILSLPIRQVFYLVRGRRQSKQNQQYDKMKIAFEEMKCESLFSQMEFFILQHHFNGKFLVFQTQLPT